ncbi:hypothetical protein SK128_025310, partial [Halocaridina rubra]
MVLLDVQSSHLTRNYRRGVGLDTDWQTTPAPYCVNRMVSWMLLLISSARINSTESTYVTHSLPKCSQVIHNYLPSGGAQNIVITVPSSRAFFGHQVYMDSFTLLIAHNETMNHLAKATYTPPGAASSLLHYKSKIHAATLLNASN